MPASSRLQRHFDLFCTAALLLLLCVATLDQGLPWIQKLWVFHAGIASVAAIVLLSRLTGFVPAVNTTRLLLPFILCVTWIGVQVLTGWTVYRYRTEVSLLIGASLLYLFATTQQLMSTPDTAAFFLRTSAVIGPVVIAIEAASRVLPRAFVDRYYPVLPDIGKHSLFAGYSAVAQWVEIFLPLVLWRSLREPRARWFWWLIAAGMIGFTILSGSRVGSLLVVLEAGAFLLYTVTGASRRKLLPWIVAGSLLAALAVVSYLQLYRTDIAGARLGYRWEMAAAALSMWRDHPLTGIGLGNYPIAHPAYARFDIGAFVNAAHNDTLQVFAEGGLVYAVLLLWLVAMHLRSILRHVWAWGLIVVWLHSCTDLPLQNASLVHWPVALLAAVGVRDAAHKEKRPRE